MPHTFPAPGHIGPFLHQQCDNLGMAVLCGEVQRRQAVTVGLVDDVGSHGGVEEPPTRVVAAVPG